MPSITLEGPLDLVRQHPEIAVGLVQGTVGIELPGQVTVALAPIVIDSGAPPGRDGAGGPYLTVFAASMGGIDMESETGARQVLDAMAGADVSDADRLRMTAIILKLASDAARQILEAMMTTSEYEKTFVERIHDDGKAEGKAEAVLRLLDGRRLAPSKEQRQQVIACTDAAQLNLWFDRAITAGTAAEVFAD
jgi:hypothetical protein